MKKQSEIKYPHAANLFRFCRRVLDHKYGGVRVIDQDVGQILGFDPADCSHWKKGKKNIRSIQAMRSIADHLGVDERLVVEVASGEIGVPEAFFEFTGYGASQIDGKLLERAKKEFYRKQPGTWSGDTDREFRRSLHPDPSAIIERVAEIHEAINFQEAPLYLPEVVAAFPTLTLRALADEQADVSVQRDGERMSIAYPTGSEVRPYMRYRIAKAMACHFLPAREFAEGDELQTFAQHFADVEGNIFAAHLLAPARLIREEVRRVHVGKDLVSQLAEVFWVSKTFVNRRLTELIAS